MPEWLDAPLSATDEPTVGHLIEPSLIRRGDYLLDFSDGRGSWLRISAVASVEGQWCIWYGRGTGACLRPPPGMRPWVLRSDEALALMRGRSSSVVRPYGAREQAMEDLLRGFSTKAELLAGWCLADPPASQAAEAWELLLVSDALNGTTGAGL